MFQINGGFPGFFTRTQRTYFVTCTVFKKLMFFIESIEHSKVFCCLAGSLIMRMQLLAMNMKYF